MNHSEFWTVLDREFGAAYGQALARSLALPSFGHRTASDLLEAGEAPQSVWAALCAEMDIEDQTFLHRRYPDET